MKDRVREALFNLLGPRIEGKHAIDLFAGTGAVGLEALSRGAARATFVEQHHPTAAVLRQNIAALGVECLCEVVVGDVFRWAERLVRTKPAPQPQEITSALSTPTAVDNIGRATATPAWAVFCSPPYDYYVQRFQEMVNLLGALIAAAPEASLFAVECDKRFDFCNLPDPSRWDVRIYSPAVIGIYQKGL